MKEADLYTKCLVCGERGTVGPFFWAVIMSRATKLWCGNCIDATEHYVRRQTVGDLVRELKELVIALVVGFFVVILPLWAIISAIYYFTN